MAAEVSVCDVLCEAMEYLSKLGSNLRSRSENLKEKRISKSKLRNTHAIHKAAKKVLLICELSKKSLENVETGVRKVLSSVDASQAQIDSGGKIDDKKKQGDKKFYHFDYKSYKLRISKKISLKHFTGVKVLIKPMPISMQERYPVYHDCKLKRLRRKQLEKQSSGKRKCSSSKEASLCVSDQNENIDKSNEDEEESMKHHNSDSNKSETSTKAEITENSLQKTETDRRKSTEFTILEHAADKSPDLLKVQDDSPSNLQSNHGTDESEVNLVKGKTCVIERSGEKAAKSSYRRFSRITVIDDDSSEDEPSKNTHEKESQSSGKENEINSNIIESEPKSKKRKLNETDDISKSKEDSDHNSAETNGGDNETKPLIRCVNITKLLKPDVLDEVIEKPKSQKSTTNQLFNMSRVPKSYTNCKKKQKENKNSNSLESKSDNEFWAQKRIEVKQFKPKKFTVNIMKLSELNTNFLLTHNLKKVTHGYKTICELTEIEDKKETENLEENIDKVKNALLNESGSDDTDDNLLNKARKVKKTLLNDSDSDTNRQSSKTPVKNDQVNQETFVDTAAIKDALLKGSDSENKEENNTNDSNTNNITEELDEVVVEKIKNALLNDSDSDSQNISETISTVTKEPHNSAKDTENIQNQSDSKQCEFSQDPENIKSCLLNDSSDSGSKSPVIEKKKKLKMSRLKRRQAMEAKKSLLNYSSSSENESENTHKSDEDTKEHAHKHSRRKSSSSSMNEENAHKHSRRKSSSSSLNEENVKENKSKDSEDSSSQQKTNKVLSDDEDKEGCSLDQIDGTVDEQSNSSVSKMVRSKAKPSGSSGQNSDNQDTSDKDIDGLTNLSSLNKPHRRRDSSTSNAGSRTSKKNSRPKATPVIGEELLRSESSSDGSNEHNMEEDLPPVKFTLNGDSIGHLAKDDLLEESDSSVSHKQDQSEVEENHNVDDSEEEEEEESVKLKRQRKANAISSDSEGGTSHRKQRDEDVKVSDFEDSEDESSESAKRSKRKKKGSESDASAASSTDGGQKKRRRIKTVKDSDISGSDTENEGRNKHGRKNIRKVMGKNQLEEATKKAAREEKERIARITERQKLYNNLEFDESGKPDEVVLEKVVLDFDPETKEPLIEVDRGLVKKLKPHQANGIKFMWDACFESVKRIKKDKGSGCILAHCMGLGKTLQVISLTHTLLIHGPLTGVNRVLVVCPLSTVLNWVNEFKMWLKHARSEFEVDVYELSRYKQNSERAFQLQQWFDGGGVCVLGYEMFRNLSADNNKKFKKKMLRSFQESLVDPGPDLVVCDEGHLLKNEKTSLSQSMNRVKTRRRIVLTGTPLQNNLKEYYCMVQFVKPNLLGKYNEYLNRFVNPITNGQYTDSTEHDIKVMKRRSHVLHKMLDGAVQRRDYGVLAPFLPPKHEYVLFITLSDVQVKLYQFYLDNYSRRPLPGKSSGFLFPDFQSLQRIWTHPLVLKYNSERYEIMQQKKREREEEDSEGSLVDFIDDDSTPEETSTEESSEDLSDDSDDSRKKSKKKKSAKKGKGKDSKVGTRRGTRANPVEVEDDDPDVAEVVEVKNENPTEWWIKLVDDEELDDMRNSHKLVLLFDILRQCETIGDKLLVFSQSLYSLDLIEHFLGKVDEATQEGRIDEKLGGHVGSWSPGVDYFRLDGSTSCENRSIWCKNFNREDNPRARLFLISTRAGGLGINLVAANRVVIFDVSWNPSHDVQSIFRVYRFGQKKPCYVYRFLAMGTMEEKIYERQVTKQAISKRVIDEQQIDRHYAENDLAELYKFDARPQEPRPLPTLPKDRLFAEMLREHEAQIYKYHEHDSLLENKEEETLSEEERKAAWEDFENEKNKPPPAPFPSAWPMHNGMMPGLLAQQQQQLAYATLASMLRKDMPHINDNQIRDMLPIIYNSNPGLMQKLSEMYKYTQPGMMVPGMMNPVMNPGAAGGGGGMGGTSGLQYEPPWQRQHQQQQQLRLQQLLHQNPQMGAKFYAGGLGSRDPVAMALQQHRAREIMSGTGRPRGRPPLAPRHPPAPAQDVVNLDSD